jgi:bacteriocin biosynthesis cyclodehydratase domain-containing protein
VTHEDREAAEAGDPGCGDQQGRLRVTGGRGTAGAPRPPAQPARHRLKRSVEPFTASDGSLYLLRLGAGDDLAIADPSPADREVLAALADGYASERELRDRLAGAGIPPDGVGETLAQLRDAGVLEVDDRDGLLDPETTERYDRQLAYLADLTAPGEPAAALQKRLGETSVALLGCGGLGSWVACGLSCAGIGRLTLIDDDRVELSNLNRQLLFAEAAIGELKVEAAAATLRAHNRRLETRLVRRRVRGPGDLADVLEERPDLLISTGDWPPHELPRWVNGACLRAGVPWIGAGQFPPRLRVGPLVVPGRSACLECLEIAARRDYPLYAQIADRRAASRTPDASVGPVSAVIGSLIASEAMHFLLGAFTPASVGNALLFDLATMELAREPVAREPACPECAAAVDSGSAWA